MAWAKAGNSQRQRDDVRNILSARGPTIDRSYVMRWVAELDLELIWRQCIEEAD